MTELRHMRKDYRQAPLVRANLRDNPFDQFHLWFQETLKAKVSEPNAMVLATVDDHYRPSSRILLLKEYDDKAFIFFSNYHSRKALELEKHPLASMVFWWAPLMRQVRIEGKVEKADPKISQDYFEKRDRYANIGVYASRQSQIIPSRTALLEAFEKYQLEFNDLDNIPCPDFWGAYALIPDQFEFWSGGEFRLHDRFQYTKKDNGWLIDRLAP